MSEENTNLDVIPEEKEFVEKRDSKGRRITKKRMESMKKNLVHANRSRVAKKQKASNVDEYTIESESDNDTSDSDSDDEILSQVMKKKYKHKAQKTLPDPRIDRLESVVATLAQEVKRSHKQIKKAQKPSKSEKIVLINPTSNTSEKKKQTNNTNALFDLLKSNVMY